VTLVLFYFYFQNNEEHFHRLILKEKSSRRLHQPHSNNLAATCKTNVFPRQVSLSFSSEHFTCLCRTTNIQP